MLYAAIAVCACLFVFGGRLGASDAVRPPAPGLTAREATLTVDDFPQGTFIMEQGPASQTGVKDGYQRLFGMCDCRIGESVPLFAVAGVNVLEDEDLANLGLQAAKTDYGRDYLRSQFDKGADGGATASSQTHTLPAPKIGDGSIVFELPFNSTGFGAGVAYIGVVRVREVLATVAIAGRDGSVHPEDLHDLMRVAAGRVMGDPPPTPRGADAKGAASA